MFCHRYPVHTTPKQEKSATYLRQTTCSCPTSDLTAEGRVEPVEHPLFGEQPRQWLAVVVRTLRGGEFHQFALPGKQRCELFGLTGPELLVLGIGNEKRSADRPGDIGQG